MRSAPPAGFAYPFEQRIANNGFSTIGTAALAARAAKAGFGWLIRRMAGVRTSRVRNLAINSMPLMPGILWSTTRQSQAHSSAPRNSSALP